MRLRRLLSPLLLALAILLTQTGGAMHALSHTLEEQKQDKSLPHDKLCDLCAAYAQIGSAIASIPLVFVGLGPDESLLLIAVTKPYSSTFAAFAARAPPYSV